VPDTLLPDPADLLGQALDFFRPVAVLLFAILQAISDADDPYAIVATLMAAVPPGSFLVLSHPGSDIDPDKIAEATDRLNRLSHQQVTLRSHAEFSRFFDGLDLLEPGVVRVEQWRPRPLQTVHPSAMWGGLARKS
jgi:hypothetical protein